MKTLSVLKPFFILAALAGMQMACGLGSSAPSGAPPALPATIQPAQSTSAATAPSERGTAAEAQAMLALAVQHYQTAGRDQALADFTGRVSPFFDRDLYVVCMNSSHIETANGGFPQYVGTSADGLMDDTGKPLGAATWDAASSDRVNSVSYHWVNPVSGQTEPKTLYFEKIGDDVCGVGVYSP